MFSKLVERLRCFHVRIGGRVGEGGSGVVWSTDGLVLTNAHVMREREPLVILNDGRRFAGTLVAWSGRRDLAAIRIPATGLATPQLGNSDRLQVGQLVLAMGNPLGITGAVTTGIIHSTGPLRMRGQSWIQADIALAPGNSGGILADMDGSIIGINTMILDGLALAVPVNSVAGFLSAQPSKRAA